MGPEPVGEVGGQGGEARRPGTVEPKELGLQPGAPVQIRTANGTVTGWRTRLGLLQLGDIQLREVAALITPGMEGHEVLLGMSALKQLEFTQKGGTLVLRQSTR